LRSYWVYILTNRTRTLYLGVTNDLERRLYEHENHLTPGFTSRYAINRLVYAEEFDDVTAAIEREKEIKKWRRSMKVALIESVNPKWRDLRLDWFERAKTDRSA
jgi:putative endonuclease